MKMKDELRKQIIKKRKDLPKHVVIKRSNIIKKKVFQMDEYQKAQTILFYVSYDNEVFTHDMIKESLSNGKKVVVPKSDTKNNTLLLSELTSWDDLEIGAYTILEPKEERIREVSVESIYLTIIPGVVFDVNGNRIGHGKGYYDRLLKKSTRTLSIGLAFEFQIVDEIPAEEHDERIDIVVTEERIINCTS